MTAKHKPATALPRIRMAVDGVTRERYDTFASEWLPMPTYWTEAECRQFCAALVGVNPKTVKIEERA